MFTDLVTRTLILSATASAVALAVCPAAASAAEDAKHHDQMGKTPASMTQLMKMDPEECMKMMDHGSKGHVTKKEFMKFQEDLWKKMDKNKDGRADRAEFTDAG